MLNHEEETRSALQSLIKGALVLLALGLLKLITAVFHIRSHYGSISIADWIGAAILLFAVGFLITLYNPLRTVATFYLAVLTKVGKLPGREKYLPNLTAAAGNLALLAVVLGSYGLLLPVVLRFNTALLRSQALPMTLSVGILLAVIAILLLLWKNAHPMIDLFSERVANKVSTLSGGHGPVACPSCGTSNNDKARFCASCGGKLNLPPAAPPILKNGCPKCAADNLPDAKFCLRCGTSLQMAPPAPRPPANRCPQCGCDNTEKDRFCARCGRRLGALASAEQTAPPPAPPPQPRATISAPESGTMRCEKCGKTLPKEQFMSFSIHSSSGSSGRRMQCQSCATDSIFGR